MKSLEFRPTTPEDQPAIAAFLQCVFRSPVNAPFLEPRLLHWKYYDPRPDWEGSRSYGLWKGSDLVAHMAVCPMRVTVADRTLVGLSLIDWAASPEHPGSGVILLRKVRALADFLIVPGGSDDTRAVLPKIGFRHWADWTLWVRVVSPWHLLRTDPRRNWKLGARLARNVRYLLQAPGPRDQSVQAVQTREFPVRQSISGYPADTLNYYLRCPAAQFRGFVLSQAGQASGYALLSTVAGQTRLADVQTTDLPHMAAAVEAARQLPATGELAAVSVQPEEAARLQQLGFRAARQQPIYLSAPPDLFPADTRFRVPMLAGDSAFLYIPGDPYLS